MGMLVAVLGVSVVGLWCVLMIRSRRTGTAAAPVPTATPSTLQAKALRAQRMRSLRVSEQMKIERPDREHVQNNISSVFHL